MFKALWVEIKNTIFKTWYHFVRFFGLMIVPLIYGFSYIFAFYDPFSNVDQVKTAVMIGQKNGEKNILGSAIARELNKEQAVHLGDVKMTMKMSNIYYNYDATTGHTDSDVDQIVRDNYAVLMLPDMSDVTSKFYDYYEKYIAAGHSLNPFAAFTAFKEAFGLIQGKKDFEKMKFVLNDKKSYLLAFGMETAAGMTSTYQTIMKVALDSMLNAQFINDLEAKVVRDGKTFDKSQWTSFVHKVQGIGFHNLLGHESIIKIKSHMGEKAKYGYGLAPFFISVAMWIGGMVMTFAVHRKIYDTSITPGYRYFAKWLLIVFGVFVQATVLLTALYFIGFKDLGLSNWLTLYGTSLITGITFASIIQAIRFSIHERNIGIIVTIILLVLQMASAGGLFPVDVQNGFYGFLNKIVPMGRTTVMLREAAFETNWSKWLENLGYLVIWMGMIPIGVWINRNRTIRIYVRQRFEMPPKMAHMASQRQLSLKTRKAKRARRAGGK